jgi:hypothetical protein
MPLLFPCSAAHSRRRLPRQQQTSSPAPQSRAPPLPLSPSPCHREPAWLLRQDSNRERQRGAPPLPSTRTPDAASSQSTLGLESVHAGTEDQRLLACLQRINGKRPWKQPRAATDVGHSLFRSQASLAVVVSAPDEPASGASGSRSSSKVSRSITIYEVFLQSRCQQQRNNCAAEH